MKRHDPADPHCMCIGCRCQRKEIRHRADCACARCRRMPASHNRTFYLLDEDYAKMVDFAGSHGMSVVEMVRSAVKLYIDIHEQSKKGGRA